jgi:hypothetical protein
MATIKADFDGRAFVPREAVELPVGTTVEVLVPPRPPTEEEQREWQAILQEIAATEPAFPTVEEALRHSRGRP